MYREQRAEETLGGSVRAVDCVADFIEWAGKLQFATYDYAKAPDAIIREILQESLGPPVHLKTGKVFTGYVIRKSDVQVGVK